MGVGDQQYAPAVLHPGKARYPFYRRLGRPQGRSGQVRKISPQPGVDPRTVKPVEIRYTDWAIPARVLCSRDVYDHVNMIPAPENFKIQMNPVP
jgi:hypothetical protein